MLLSHRQRGWGYDGRGILALLCLLLLASSSARAQSPDLPPAPFKVADVGTRLIWKDLQSGKRETSIVQAADGLIVRWLWGGKPGASVGHFCMDCVFAGVGADGGVLAPLYPLEVGKGVHFTRRRGDRAWRDEILVAGTQTVETPAGAFDTYVVVRRSKSLDDSWHAEQRNWYAPALGWIVKFDGANSRGEKQSWHLIKIE